jgi:hypothetical protein
MAPSSANGVPDRDSEGTGTESFPGTPAVEAHQPPGGESPTGASLSTDQLLERLAADRLWLLQQIDGGHWSDLRLDLAALERELGQVLEQASQRVKGS